MLKKSGTHLHESAATHARTLASTLDAYEVDKSTIRSFLPPNRLIESSCIVHESSPPTRVMKMNIDDALIADIKRELVLRSKIDAAVGAITAVPAPVQYTPLSTQFENSVLFLPSAQRFYNRNKDIVADVFPEVETSVVNAFVVPANKRPYGVHNAASIGFQIPRLAKRGFAYPTTYVSFHTAVTPTPLDRQPLGIFEDAVVESPNTSHLWEQIRSYDLTPDEADEVDKAYYLHDSNTLSELDLPSVGHYLLCKYWEKKYGADPARASGYYCDAKPGEAVVFDNYRPHGDSTLPVSPEPRITIDIRCFSKVKYPSPSISGGIDFIMNPERKKLQWARKKAALECLLLMVGYEDLGEFLRLIYGTEDVNPFEITTDLQFSVYNKTKHYALDQDLEPHYERCEEVYRRIERDGEYVLPKRAEEAITSLYMAQAQAAQAPAG